MYPATRPIGGHLREWRQRRRLSQLALACDADISTRHLSFIETGRSLPSRDMVLRLAERLEVPLRERNLLLLAAGYAPVFIGAAAGGSGTWCGAQGDRYRARRIRALPSACGRSPLGGG